jgi:hypothetical protein
VNAARWRFTGALRDGLAVIGCCVLSGALLVGMNAARGLLLGDGLAVGFRWGGLVMRLFYSEDPNLRPEHDFQFLVRWADDCYHLTLWWAGSCRSGRDRIAYMLEHDGVTIFEAAEYKPSPLHSIDGRDSVATLLGFLSLRPGDTDDEYFDGYTPEQLEFAEQHGEELGMYATMLEEQLFEVAEGDDGHVIRHLPTSDEHYVGEELDDLFGLDTVPLSGSTQYMQVWEDALNRDPKMVLEMYFPQHMQGATA